MTLDKVTSLADLEFRAKTNKYYKQLAILGAKRCCGRLDRLKEIKTYEKAIEYLHYTSIQHNPDSCSAVVCEVNVCCNKIVEEVEPSPVVEAAPPSGDGTPRAAIDNSKLRAMVDSLKKKAVSKKKTTKARGGRSSTRSATPTPTTRARSTRRSSRNVNSSRRSNAG